MAGLDMIWPRPQNLPVKPLGIGKPSFAMESYRLLELLLEGFTRHVTLA
jgi:hypothetical protein